MLSDITVPTGWVGWVAVAITSGFAGGLVSEWAKGRIAKKDRAHDSDERKADRDHQAGLQADELENQKALQESDREHRETVQESERDHALRLRRELDHANARERFLPAAEAIHDWAIIQVARIDNDTYHYTGVAEVPSAAKEPAEVAALLRRIARGHPSRNVREAADAFHSEVEVSYSWIDMTPSADGEYEEGPSDDRLIGWEKQAGALVELLHVE